MAADFLKKQGLYIKEKNFRCRIGEVDLIAYDGTYLIFVEVKYRKTASSGYAASAVTRKKQQVISRVAQFYLVRYGYRDVPCRFDVIGIDGKQIQWIQNAFDFCG